MAANLLWVPDITYIAISKGEVCYLHLITDAYLHKIIGWESVYPRGMFNSLEHARNVIEKYIHFYNNRRPHMSIAYKVPALAHMEAGPQKKMWKSKFYKKKKCTNGNNEKPFPCQTKVGLLLVH